MDPILTHTRRQLLPGVHRFQLPWRVRDGSSGIRLFLVSAWSSHQPSMTTAGAIAVLALNPGK